MHHLGKFSVLFNFLAVLVFSRYRPKADLMCNHMGPMLHKGWPTVLTILNRRHVRAGIVVTAFFSLISNIWESLGLLPQLLWFDACKAAPPCLEQHHRGEQQCRVKARSSSPKGLQFCVFENCNILWVKECRMCQFDGCDMQP